MSETVMDLVIWGAGALGEHVQYVMSYEPGIKVRAFFDDDPTRIGTNIHGFPVLKPDLETIRALKADGATHGIVAIGNGILREKYSQQLEEEGYTIASAIHPSSQISPGVKLGKGLIILASVNLFFNPIIGDYVYMANSVTVSHDNLIDDNVELCTGCNIVSRVHLQKNVFVGAGANIVNRGDGNIVVHEGAVVGAGALVLEDVPAKAVVMGVPAKIVRYQGND